MLETSSKVSSLKLLCMSKDLLVLFLAATAASKCPNVFETCFFFTEELIAHVKIVIMLVISEGYRE